MLRPQVSLSDDIKQEKNKLLVLIVVLSLLAISKLFDSTLARLFINDLL